MNYVADLLERLRFAVIVTERALSTPFLAA